MAKVGQRMPDKYYSEQHRGNASFDEDNQVNAVELLEYDPTGTGRTLRAITKLLTLAFDYDGAGNPIYIGTSPIGSAKSSAVWQIRKLTWSGTNLTDLQWANGDAQFSNIWNNRASLTYS